MGGQARGGLGDVVPAAGEAGQECVEGGQVLHGGRGDAAGVEADGGGAENWGSRMRTGMVSPPSSGSSAATAARSRGRVRSERRASTCRGGGVVDGGGAAA